MAVKEFEDPISNTTIYMADVPAKQIPPFKYQIAQITNVTKIMVTSWGGIGDVVCGEPAARYTFKVFPGYEICMMTKYPEFFQHLPFSRFFHPDSEESRQLKQEEWLVINTNPPNDNMSRDFLLHHYTQCVDFSTLCALQRQIPIKERQIQLSNYPVKSFLDKAIVIHPGRHWQSKTFPAKWWNEVIKELCEFSDDVLIIGKDVDSETGTVDIELPSNCCDLRNKQSIQDLISVLNNARVVVTNDSAPLHIASAGKAKIVFFATCKDAEHITHWRDGQFGKDMWNLSVDGLWNHQETSPIRTKAIEIDKMPQEMLEGCLPDPEVAVQFIKNKYTERVLDEINQNKRNQK